MRTPKGVSGDVRVGFLLCSYTVAATALPRRDRSGFARSRVFTVFTVFACYVIRERDPGHACALW